jgi:hypothetical protein
MGIIGGTLGYNLLRRISIDGETGYCDGSAYQGVSKIEKLLGAKIWSDTKDKVVIDFGCGDGEDAIEVAARGARKVIGVRLRTRAQRLRSVVLRIDVRSRRGQMRKRTSSCRSMPSSILIIRQRYYGSCALC